jgi:hypothetical protein
MQNDLLIEYPNQPELALAALLCMLSKASETPSAPLTQSIAAHLNLVASDARQPDALREVAATLAGQWSARDARQQNAALH